MVLLTERELRRRLGDISAMTLWRWRERGILSAPIKINGRNYYPEDEPDRIVAASRAAQPQPAEEPADEVQS